MKDWIILLILAIFGIIGYRLMGRIDRSIDRHTAGSDKPEREKKTNEHAETGKPRRADPCLSVFLHIQR